MFLVSEVPQRRRDTRTASEALMVVALTRVPLTRAFNAAALGANEILGTEGIPGNDPEARCWVGEHAEATSERVCAMMLRECWTVARDACSGLELGIWPH